MNSVKMQNLSSYSPSFTSLLFAWFIGCMISVKLVVAYGMIDMKTIFLAQMAILRTVKPQLELKPAVVSQRLYFIFKQRKSDASGYCFRLRLRRTYLSQRKTT